MTDTNITTEWRALPGLSGDRQIFTIGDIHGEDAVFRKALEHIKSTERTGQPTTLVLLGDLNDRGPGSLKCIDMAFNGEELAAVDEVIYLPGNHELMMIEDLSTQESNSYLWLGNGGAAVVIEASEESEDFPSGNGLIKEYLLNRLPDGFVERMHGRSHARFGDLLFVHAGIHPHMDQEAFLAESAKGKAPWAWIRNEFLDHDNGWDEDRKTVVVHGHTPIESDPLSSQVHARSERIAQFRKYEVESPDYTMPSPDGCDMVKSANRINLDTGCGKYLKQTVVAEFTNNQYRLSLI